MNDLASQKLGELIAANGTSVCQLPRILKVMLQQQCPECPEEVHLLLQAVQLGIVERLQMAPAEDRWSVVLPSALEALAQSTPQGEAAARWAVKAWMDALVREPTPGPVPQDLPVPEVSLPPYVTAATIEEATLHALAVTLAGALGGFLPIVQFDPLPIKVFFGVQNALFGALGGAMGGVLGWMLARGNDGRCFEIGSVPRVALVAFGALACAMSGAICGGMFNNPAVVCGLAFLGAGAGTWLGYRSDSWEAIFGIFALPWVLFVYGMLFGVRPYVLFRRR